MTAEGFDDVEKLFLRFLVGGLMLFHGVDKLVHGPGHVQADLVSGVWTRLSAAVYALSIAFATPLVHKADFVHLAPTGAWAAELWAFYIASPVAVALLGQGRHVLWQGGGP